jgi:hypothetical protein
VTTPQFNYLKTVVSQYANSSIILALLENFDECVDPTANLDQFYAMIWDVDTAQGYGLDVWGRIVGVNRVITVTTGKFFGFDEATTVSADPFNQSPFWTGSPNSNNVALSDTAFRTLIFAKALANICDGSVKAINQLLMNLFPGIGNCYVTDGLDMTMVYNFSTHLTDVQLAIVQNTGVLPRPAGVLATVVEPP